LDGLKSKEPHLSALGGSLALESLTKDFVKDLQASGLSLHFVFDGLDSGAGHDRVANSKKAAELNRQAFELYMSEQGRSASHGFQATGCDFPVEIQEASIDPSLGPSDFTTLSEILKKTLHELGVPFTVAPYSALAQVRFVALRVRD